MLSSIAIAAAMVGAVAASPAYGYGGYPAESVVYSTSLVTVTSCGPEVTNCPAKGYSTPAPYYPASTSTPAPYVPYTSEAPVYSSPAPYYSAPVYNSSVVVPYVTKTVYSYSYYTSSDVVYTSTVDYYTTVCPETETPVYTPVYTPSSTEVYPVETSSICSESSTVTVVVPPTPYPTPSGTGYIPYPSSSTIWGTASSSGYYAPSATYPAEFTGAASHANAGLAVAGLGAFAALFL